MGFCGHRRRSLPVSVKPSLSPSPPPPPYCLMSLGCDLGCGPVRLLSLPQEGSLPLCRCRLNPARRSTAAGQQSRVCAQAARGCDFSTPPAFPLLTWELGWNSLSLFVFLSNVRTQPSLQHSSPGQSDTNICPLPVSRVDTQLVIRSACGAYRPWVLLLDLAADQEWRTLDGSPAPQLAGSVTVGWASGVARSPWETGR